MKRRSFNQLLTAFAALKIGSTNASAPRKKIIKPGRLKRGNTIGLISPGSFISDEKLQKAVTNLETMGFKVWLSPNIRKVHGFVAGTDAERLADLHQCFANNSIDGIWCARGGYGCGRLLPHLNYRLIRQNPKVLVGFSDITALLVAIFEKTGLIGFHGPVASSDFTPYTIAQLQSVLMKSSGKHQVPVSPDNRQKAATDTAFEQNVLSPGQASGCLTGGNLSLLAAAAGTPFQPKVKGKILIIEEIGEAPYRIDRMLTQLRQSYPLSDAKGIVLGIFAGCEKKEDSLSLSLQETLSEQLSGLGIPVMTGLPFGHISDNAIFPIGIKAKMNTDGFRLTFLESGVE